MKLHQAITLKKNYAYIHPKMGGLTHKRIKVIRNINAYNLMLSLPHILKQEK
jgi:hypothetical protein